MGSGASLANAPGSTGGISTNDSWGLGFDTSDWVPFKYHSKVTATNYTVGAFVGGGVFSGYYPGDRHQFSGPGSSSNTCAGFGLDGAGFGITKSSGLTGVQFDFFGPGFGVNVNHVRTFTTISPLY